MTTSLSGRYKAACAALGLPEGGAGACGVDKSVIIERRTEGKGLYRIVPRGYDMVWYQRDCPALDFSAPGTIGLLRSHLDVLWARLHWLITVDRCPPQGPAWQAQVCTPDPVCCTGETEADAIIAALEIVAEHVERRGAP